MKIYFDGVEFGSRTGPNTFALRLARQLSSMGHVLADNDDYDVALVFIQPSSRLRRDRPFVLRLDGFWMKPEQHASGMNERIIDACRRASHVVWQSEFDERMCRRWLDDCDGTVIKNGIEIQERRCDLDALLRIRSEHDEVFVCSANWHPQKRLNDNVRLFQALRKSVDRSCLIVLGDGPRLTASRQRDRIFFAGSLEHAVCMSVYSIADWMLHLAWLDHCPNTVVEALSVKTPVICSGDGGTRELIEHGDQMRGVIIEESVRHSMQLVDYDAPPEIDLSDFDPSRSTLVTPNFDVSDLAIGECARKYELILDAISCGRVAA